MGINTSWASSSCSMLLDSMTDGTAVQGKGSYAALMQVGLDFMYEARQLMQNPCQNVESIQSCTR